MDAPVSTSQPSYLEALPKVASSSSPVQSVPLDPETNSNDNATSSIPPAKAFAASSNSSSSIAVVPRRRDLRRQFATIFLASLGILQAVKAIGILIRAQKSSKSVRQILVAILRSLYKLDLTNIKSSLFFSAFPVLYRYLTIRSLRVSGKTHHLEDNKVRRDAHNNERSSIMPRGVGEGTFLTTVAPILVLGPLANLLPANIITQLNLYVICAAGMACARVLNDRVENRLTAWQSKADQAQHGIENAARGGKTPYVPYYMNKTANKDAPFNKHFSFLDPDPSISTSASTERVNRSVSSTSLVVAKTLWKAVSSGGGWWLFPLTQGLLLDTAVFESDCFPTSYKNVIVSRSKRYLPSAASLSIPETSSFKSSLPLPTKLITMLPLFTLPPFPHPGFPLSSDSITTSSLFSSHVLESQYSPFLPIMQLAHPAHNRAICATLHPLQPSCSVNFLASVKESMGSAFALVGGYSAIMTLLRFKKIRQDPRGALLRWLISSARGAGFVTLAISNAWAWVCVFQRTLNPNTLQRGRFGLGGMLAGLWVFLVPAARRLELGLYSVRLSMLTFWKIGLKKGWWKARRRLAFAPFAIGLAILVHLKRQRLAPMESWVGKGVTWLDGDHETLVKTNATSERKLGDM